MKHVFSKKWLITFSAIVAAIGIAWACADEWDVVWNSSNFAPEASVEKEYTSFFYDPYTKFYGIGFDTQHSTRFNSDVVNDWYGFLNGKMEKKNIDLLLLSNDTNNDLEELNKIGRASCRERV